MNEEKSDFWSGLGTALVILALCLGIGGCNYLIQKGEAEKEKAKHPTVTETQE